MGLTKIKKGLNIPITGDPKQMVHEAKFVKKVAILGNDYVGLKPTMKVEIGDDVKLGQVLFTDKKMPKVNYTAPASGKVIEINRGEKRIFLSLVIQLEGTEEVTFKSYSEKELNSLSAENVKELLLESGMWTALRERPFGKTANPDVEPHSIFITAMDTNPLSPSVDKTLEGLERDFINGATVLSKLTGGKTFVCKTPGSSVPAPENTATEEFAGPHPAGNPGTHIHFLDPVSRSKKVWHIGAQDVVAIGKLFTTGHLYTERIISIAGPRVANPRLVKTRLGASIDEIVEGELKDGENRIISGSVLSGRKADSPENYLGRYHQQISVIEEGRKREFLGWLYPGSNLYSIRNIVLSKFISRSKKFSLDSALNGGPRAIVPSGNYEMVMPMDLVITYLLRAIAVDDVEEAEKLGILELDEEDLALCTFVCPSKINHGSVLRRNLNLIEKEG